MIGDTTAQSRQDTLDAERARLGDSNCKAVLTLLEDGGKVIQPMLSL